MALGAVLGFGGVALSNPLAWVGAVVILIPAYVRAHRALARMPVDPLEPTLTTPIALVGPDNSSLNVDAVVTEAVPIVVQKRWKKLLRR